MNSMFLSDMQEKQVISVVSGQNYGHIIDVAIDEKGSVVKFLVESSKMFRKIKSGDISFSYSDIEKIGEDVILVRV